MKQLKDIEMVVIGTSAGGVDALKLLLPAFKKANLTVAVVIHLPAQGPNLIPELFNSDCDFDVIEAQSGVDLKRETIYIAPPDYHLNIEANKTLSLSTENPINFSRPSIDFLFESAGYAFKNRLLGILLTGANHDGAEGLKVIHGLGGITVIQDPAEAEYSQMPEAGLELVKPDYLLKLQEIEKLIENLCILRKEL